VVHPFRFIAPMPSLALSRPQFRDALRHIEDVGFDSVAVSEHLSLGWWMEPMTALMSAAQANDRLRLLSLVLSNDFRHPVILHKMAATLDMLSGGRLELGLGAGWMADDYAAAGIPFDAPSVRIARLAESVRVLKGLFGPVPYTFHGQHYQIRGLDGQPKPVQQPHPRLLIGGGGRKVLSLAAAEADIVGVHCNLESAALGSRAAADLALDRIAAKVSWVRQAALAAGRSLDCIELQLSIYWCQVTDSDSAARAATSVFSDLIRADPALLSSSPAVLVGSAEQCIDTLRERRERFGFSYIKLGGDVDAVAPIVSRLAGT
jgi:probable F420-dependent oxidoreductase